MSEKLNERNRRSRRAIGTIGTAMAIVAVGAPMASASPLKKPSLREGAVPTREYIAPSVAEKKDRQLSPEQRVHRTATDLAGQFLAQYRKQANTGRPQAQTKLLALNEAGTRNELKIFSVVPHEAHLGAYKFSAIMPRNKNGKLVPGGVESVEMTYTEYDIAGKEGPSEDTYGITTYSLIMQRVNDGPDKDNRREWRIRQGVVTGDASGAQEVMFTGNSSFNAGGFGAISNLANDVVKLQAAGEAFYTGHESQK